MKLWFSAQKKQWHSLQTSYKAALATLMVVVFILPFSLYSLSQNADTRSKAAYTSSGFITPTPTPKLDSLITIRNSISAGSSPSNYLLIPRDTYYSSINLSGAFTIEFWFKLNDITTPRQSLFRSAGDHIAIWTNPASIKGYAYVMGKVSDGTKSNIFYISSSVISPGEWNHFAISYFPSEQYCKLNTYLNGVVQCAGDNTPAFTDDRTNLQISKANPAASEFGIIDGSIDELRISNTTRYTHVTGPGSYVFPTSRFTPDGATLALFSLDGNYLDSSQNQNYLSSFGSLTFNSSTVPYGGTSPYSRCMNLGCTQIPGIGYSSCTTNSQCQSISITPTPYPTVVITKAPTPTPTPYPSVTPTPAPKNRIINPSFETSMTNIWIPKKLGVNDIQVTNYAHSGSYSFRMYPLASGNPAKILEQTLANSAFPAGTTFTLSGWNRVNAALTSGAIKIIVISTNVRTNTSVPAQTAYPLFLSTTNTIWQQALGNFKLVYPASSLKVRIKYTGIGTGARVFFDDIQFITPSIGQNFKPSSSNPAELGE